MRDAIGSPYFRSIVVSGASGFIGRRLAARLRGEHPEADLKCLVKIDDDAFCRSGSEFLCSRGIRPVPVELVSGRGLHDLRAPDVLFHLAAHTHTWEKDHSCNDIGTENLLQALEPLGPKNHVLFTSTVAAMDNRVRLDQPLTSDTPIERPPLTRYGLTKLRAEEYLKKLAKKSGFRLTILRLCTVYGPNPRPNTFCRPALSPAGNSTVSSCGWQRARKRLYKSSIDSTGPDSCFRTDFFAADEFA